ncbi:hypothetical protein [Flavobacterium kingsejongi]|uniref:Uncharacterized protein n=1 Tax=Flavobacterium kingsejongi TaxID=1678728 RepID=A0A2S1LRR4_9FLAO|nr:hypothetical protein [Flavobacterium kingsejongi]AWG26453.1 hypothetical protein FK004_15085 [Flavobacterium kingsejongi]
MASKTKKLTEILLLKDMSIHKVQFDTEWFYALEDMAFYLKEDLSEVETVQLPVVYDGIRILTPCATLEDIERGRP